MKTNTKNLIVFIILFLFNSFLTNKSYSNENKNELLKKSIESRDSVDYYKLATCPCENKLPESHCYLTTLGLPSGEKYIELEKYLSAKGQCCTKDIRVLLKESADNNIKMANILISKGELTKSEGCNFVRRQTIKDHEKIYKDANFAIQTTLGDKLILGVASINDFVLIPDARGSMLKIFKNVASSMIEKGKVDFQQFNNDKSCTQPSFLD